jgi:hypothetical protein
MLVLGSLLSSVFMICAIDRAASIEEVITLRSRKRAATKKARPSSVLVDELMEPWPYHRAEPVIR